MTMNPLLDPAGRSIALASEPLATGGEGSIFTIPGDPDRVAKVYKTAPATEHAAKLKAMADRADPALLKVAAWPLTTLHREPGGPVAGVLMPKVVGSREIHHLYSVAQRKKDFPEADWRFLIHAARNCALAFETIHAAGHVIGDVNQKNILVSAQTLIHFVDCDSFQVRTAAGKIYRCVVGVPEFTPPELQGQSFRAIDRTPNHDRFGLAVLIFHLLMMGRHPFSGIYTGSGEMPLETAIQTGRFAYSKSPALTEMSPPPGTPPVALLDPDLYPLFERAFAVPVLDSRPSPTEWADALTATLGQLAACPVDPRHNFPRGLGGCPWCELIGTAGVLFFLPGQSIGTGANPNFNLAAVWAEIAPYSSAEFQYARPTPTVIAGQVGEPVPAALGAPTPRPAPPGSPTVGFGFEVLAALGLMTSLLLLCCARTTAVVGLVVFGGWLVVLLASRKRRRDQALTRYLHYTIAVEDWEHENRRWVKEFRSRTARRDQLQTKLAKLETTFEAEAATALASFQKIREPLLAARARHDELTRQYQLKRQTIVRDSARLQRNQWLDSVLIADHRINGISSARLASLRSFGIETAADVAKLEQGQVKVPQIGPRLTERLVAWRDEQAAAFRFDASLQTRDLMAFDRNHRALIDPAETTLAAGPAPLRDLATRFRHRKARVLRQIQAAVDGIHQAEFDVAIMERMLT